MRNPNKNLMVKAGFRPCTKSNLPVAPDGYSFWVNKSGIMICVTHCKKLTVEGLVNHAVNQAAYITRKRIKEQIAMIDFGVKGFTK